MLREVERERALQHGMREAVKGSGPDALMAAINQYRDDPDIGKAIEQVRMNGYAMCMCVAATGDASLFKLVCQMGARPFDIDEASGDSPLSLVLFFMNRNGPGTNEELFKHLLDIGAMREYSSYCLFDIIGSIWDAGVQAGKSSQWLQLAIDAGLDPMCAPSDDPDNASPRGCQPLDALCQTLDSDTVDCLAWLLDSGAVAPAHILNVLAVEDGCPAKIDHLANDPVAASRILDVVGRAQATVCQATMQRQTHEAIEKAPAGPGPRL